MCLGAIFFGTNCSLRKDLLNTIKKIQTFHADAPYFIFTSDQQFLDFLPVQELNKTGTLFFLEQKLNPQLHDLPRYSRAIWLKLEFFFFHTLRKNGLFRY